MLRETCLISNRDIKYFILSVYLHVFLLFNFFLRHMLHAFTLIGRHRPKAALLMWFLFNYMNKL